MKAKMITAILVAVASLLAVFIFAGLYFNERQRIRTDYIAQFEENLFQAAKEIDTYSEKGTDYDLHYSMAGSDLGAARAMIFCVSDYTEKQKIINEIHYCFIKYPEQMRDKLPEASQAFHDVADHLDKGYDELRAIIESVDKLGN